MTPWIRSITASVVMLASTSLWALSPIYTVQTGLGSVAIDDESDSYHYLTGAALLSTGVGNNSLIDLQGEVSTWNYSDDDHLDSEEIFLQGTYSYTPTAGFRVPTYSLALRYLEEFGAEDALDASTVTLILSLAYRIDDRTSIRGGVKFGDRDSESEIDSDIFGYFVNLDLIYSENLLFYTTVGLDEGAENNRSYCSGAYLGESNSANRQPGSIRNRQHFQNSNREDAFSGECDNTYFVLGANYALNANHSFDASATFQDYDTPVGSLDVEIYAIDYFYRF